MWDRDCGVVPIVNEDRVLRGMITDRDIAMAAYSQGNGLRALRIAEGMSPYPRSCKPDDELVDALAIMAEARVHRLPVVDEEERLLGLLSVADALHATTRCAKSERKALSERVLESLAEVKTPRIAPEPVTPEEREKHAPVRKRGKRVHASV
jgi:CBS-domain-containing membrane protein